MILCDIGNTSAHFLENGQSWKVSISEFNPEKFEEKIYFISVNRKISEQIKSKNLKNWIDLSQFVNINSEYKTLGIDRKVAILNLENAIVVDAGSAVTIDVLENKKHIGGYILAGRLAIQKSYEIQTPHLKFRQNDKILNLNELPNNTENAIFYGYLHQIISLIKEIKNSFRSFKLIITGGDGKLISEYFPESEFREFLIFENLQKIIKENFKENN